MKQLFFSLLLLMSTQVFAQKRAYILHDSLNGQIRKVEVRFFKLSYDKSGRLIKKPDISNTKVEYQLDDQHFIFREERWFDYSSLDLSGKTKPNLLYSITQHLRLHPKNMIQVKRKRTPVLFQS